MAHPRPSSQAERVDRIEERSREEAQRQTERLSEVELRMFQAEAQRNDARQVGDLAATSPRPRRDLAPSPSPGVSFVGCGRDLACPASHHT